jgi:hypothetical protein
LSTHAFLQVHDIIQLSSPDRSSIYEKILEFSANGMSPRWISTELKVSKSFVNDALGAAAKERPKRNKETKSPSRCVTRIRGGRTPFGFDYIDSRLVENPRELHAIQKLIELWNAGNGPSAVAAEMNRLKLKTRNGKRWDHSVVSDIVVRAQNKSGVYARFSNNLRPYKARMSPKSKNLRSTRSKTMKARSLR